MICLKWQSSRASRQVDGSMPGDAQPGLAGSKPHSGDVMPGGDDTYKHIIEGSLEVKLPTIWTVEKQR